MPKNSRVCSFKQLAGVAQISTDDVERLVMRTISKGLVKGRINQVGWGLSFRLRKRS